MLVFFICKAADTYPYKRIVFGYLQKQPIECTQRPIRCREFVMKCCILKQIHASAFLLPDFIIFNHVERLWSEDCLSHSNE